MEEPRRSTENSRESERGGVGRFSRPEPHQALHNVESTRVADLVEFTNKEIVIMILITKAANTTDCS